jgi:SPP1 family predicted phage head-tail adaptor
MGAGKYRHRLRIEAPTRTTNSEGQRVVTWPAATDAPYARLWGRVEQTGGSQAFDHQQQQAETVYQITLRSSPTSRAITPAMRIVMGGRTLQIGSVDDIEHRHREVVITATSKRPAAS